MNKRQQQQAAMNKLTTGLSTKAAEVFTQQPGLNEQELNKGITEENNKEISKEYNNSIYKPNNNAVMEEFNNDEVRRGPKKKGEFKKVTLNLDVDLNTALDKYILSLKQQALENGTEAPNKSEWVRDIVEEKLRQVGIFQYNHN